MNCSKPLPLLIPFEAVLSYEIFINPLKFLILFDKFDQIPDRHSANDSKVFGGCLCTTFGRRAR